MTYDLYGDWPARVKAALDAVEPTDEEKEIVKKAIAIRRAYLARIKQVMEELQRERDANFL